MIQPDDTSLLRVDHVTRTYGKSGGEVHALDDICLEVSQGVLVAFKGRSGSGKTTLLNLLGGLDRPTKGEVYFMGVALSSMNDAALTSLRCHHMGFVFQSFALLPTYSAFENVEMALRLAGKRPDEARKRAMDCLKAVGLAGRAYSRPDELSGGQQQRVALARAMANHPTILLADEPTGELDHATTRSVLGIFRRLVNEEGITLLVTSHDPLIDEVADNLYLLKDGKIEPSQN